MFKWIVLAIVIGFGLKYLSVYNNANALENSVIAEYDQLLTDISTHTNKVVEAASVTNAYTDDLTKIVEATYQGRYGENGSKALFSMINEQNIPIDTSLYKQIQQVMESGRNAINNQQRKVTDINRTYKTMLGSLVTGSMMKFAGFPRPDYAKVKLIISEAAMKSDATGVDAPVTMKRN